MNTTKLKALENNNPVNYLWIHHHPLFLVLLCIAMFSVLVSCEPSYKQLVNDCYSNDVEACTKLCNRNKDEYGYCSQAACLKGDSKECIWFNTICACQNDKACENARKLCNNGESELQDVACDVACSEGHYEDACINMK